MKLKIGLLYFLLFSPLFTLPLLAQKPVLQRDFEFGQITEPDHTFRSNQRINATTGVPIAIYNPGDLVSATEPEAMAREYLAENLNTFGLTYENLDELYLHTVRESNAGTTVRLRQKRHGVPVYGAEITVSITPQRTIGFVMNNFEYGVDLDDVTPEVGVSVALARTALHIGLASETSHEMTSLTILNTENGPKLAHRVVLMATEPLGEWESFVDAKSGEILKVENIACFYHNHHAQSAPAIPPATTNLLVNGIGNVFDPDPLSSAGASYGDPGFTDGNDANTSQLIGEQVSVTLLDITFNGTNYELSGPYAEIVDVESPFRGTFSQPSSTWNFNRTDNAFEAVNVYYHIDASMRYLNETLGITVGPSLYSGGVRCDPSGLNNADNSRYSRTAQNLAFGDGGVDDAEDSDVIHHELGHGLHDWITGGGLSQVNGLSEGCGDYWAASYNRGLGLWNSSDAPYNWTFNWDGHNAFWNGRRVNVTSQYPGGLVGQIHTDGQIWATVMMEIWDAIGQAKTDVIFWEGLGMTNGSSSQNDAANAVYQAANNLGYSNPDRLVIHTLFTNRGYTLPTFVLPVELLQFDARKQDKVVNLNWSTATETNNDRFIIERSVNGRAFQAIGTVEGAGDSREVINYDFIDLAPALGSNAYRLKQVDFDGTYAYSDIVSVDFSRDVPWTVSPNPTTEIVTISNLSADSDDEVSIVLTDLHGRTLIKKTAESLPIELEVAHLPSGTYLLQIEQGNNRWVQQVVR